MAQLADYERLGSFYLGRLLRADGSVGPEPLFYDARDLTTHAVCLGMTGSGKTGLCVSLLEEAALDGIPSIAIDPKGDLGNLLLTFPSLTAEEFRPWIDASNQAMVLFKEQGLLDTNAEGRNSIRDRNGLARYCQ